MSIFGSVLGGLGSLVGAGADIYNIGQQKKQFEWQKMAQEKTWAREDNATQRRVADLKAAGLSPTLAAGSAAQASSPITPKAPQADMSNMMNGLAISNMVENIAKTKAEKKRIQQETDIVQHDFDKLKDTPMFYFNHHQDWTTVIASAISKMVNEWKGGKSMIPGLSLPQGNVPSSPNISLGSFGDFGQKTDYIDPALKLDHPPKKSEVEEAITMYYMDKENKTIRSVNQPPNVQEMAKEFEAWKKDNPQGSREQFYKYIEAKYGTVL